MNNRYRIVGVIVCAGVLMGSSTSGNTQTLGVNGERLGRATFLSCDFRPKLDRESDEHICVGRWGNGSIAEAISRATNDSAAVGGILGKACSLSGAVVGCRGVAEGAGVAKDGKPPQIWGVEARKTETQDNRKILEDQDEAEKARHLLELVEKASLPHERKP